MEQKDLLADISSIKNMMERSTKFISLSGLSGIMAGVFALLGTTLAYKILYLTDAISLFSYSGSGYIRASIFYAQTTLLTLIIIALAVLILSVSTGIWLTIRKAKRKGLRVWNPSSKALLISGGIPLLTGGLFVLILIAHQHFGIISAACLIFYGLALVSASQHTFGDVKWLGLLDILIGLVALAVPGYGLLLWALGFGVLHILYGTIMHFKYDREVTQ